VDVPDFYKLNKINNLVNVSTPFGLQGVATGIKAAKKCVRAFQIVTLGNSLPLSLGRLVFLCN